MQFVWKNAKFYSSLAVVYMNAKKHASVRASLQAPEFDGIDRDCMRQVGGPAFGMSFYKSHTLLLDIVVWSQSTPWRPNIHATDLFTSAYNELRSIENKNNNNHTQFCHEFICCRLLLAIYRFQNQ
jgi:hypothetical protein